MHDLEYYEIKADATVFVRERSSEFFAIYSPLTKKWTQPENITFMELTHDRDYMKITKEDAIKKADGSLPEELYLEYTALLGRNCGIVKG